MKAHPLTQHQAEVNLLFLMELEFSLGFRNRTGIDQLNQKVFQKQLYGSTEPQLHLHWARGLCVEAVN